MTRSSTITGTGSFFPKERVTNEDISKLVDTNDEWIRTRTGIRERRISAPNDPTENNSSLALVAAQRALAMAGKTPADVDQIIYATSTPDTIIPSTACWFQGKLGAERAHCFDVNAACAGFVYGLSIADQFIRMGQTKTTLVVGSEVLSRVVNWEDRSSCVLFGDGAGAFVVESAPADHPNRILSTHLGSRGRFAGIIQVPAGGTNQPVTQDLLARKQNKIQMSGKEVFKEAVERMVEFAHLALAANGVKLDDVKWFVPHQANLRIIDAVAEKLKFPKERVMVSIDRFGNTSAASIPSTFDEGVRDGRIRRGDLVLFDSFGAGVTYGSALIRY